MKNVVEGVIVVVICSILFYLWSLVKVLPVHYTIPSGTIVAWKPGHDVPEGWLICNGNDGTPNLVDRFILGTDKINLSDAELVGGSIEHTHTITIQNNPKQGHPNQRGGNKDYSPQHNHPATASSESNLPPYYKLIYIMKS